MSLTPAGWKLRSHASSRLRAYFSRLIEKCELLPSCLTQFPKICMLRPMQGTKTMCKMNKWQYFPRDLWFFKEKHWERARVYKPAKTSEDFAGFRTSSEDFGLLRESSEMTVSCSKFLALPEQKSHAYISEKVGRYNVVSPHWKTNFRMMWTQARKVLKLGFTTLVIHCPVFSMA